MPKANGLTPEQRKAQLADQLGEEGAEPIDLVPTPSPAYASEPVAPSPPVPATPDMATLIQMLAASAFCPR